MRVRPRSNLAPLPGSSGPKVHNKNMTQPPPRERTLREMAAPDFTYESLCIQYPDEGVPYVLKTGLIHLLPKFHGLVGEDPHKHLKEFHIVHFQLVSQHTLRRKGDAGLAVASSKKGKCAESPPTFI
ncbi:hypothetical protein HKD37_05G012741 [Glycine soja]